MAINIKNPETDRKARELAALVGMNITEAVELAIEASLEKTRRKLNGKKRGLAADLDRIALHCASLPDLDTRSADEILGYDEHGLPT